MSVSLATGAPTEFAHHNLPSGVELAVDELPARQTVALSFRMLVGMVDEPIEHTGLNTLTRRVLSKGAGQFDGRGLADAFDAIGAGWSTASGRQSVLVRVICLPEFVSRAVELVATMLRQPTFPEDACRVAVELGLQDLKHLDDEPQDLLRVLIQRLTLGERLGRNPEGDPDTLPRLSRELIVDHWRRFYAAGRLQVAAAGPVDHLALAEQVEAAFADFGSAERLGRDVADFEFTPATTHVQRNLEQEYIAITLPGLPRDDADFAAELVLIAVLSGGMGGRLFTEVREKQGLVYWVGAWHEEPRGKGVLHLGASTTPERCDQTYRTLIRELVRLGKDLTAAEIHRARNILVSHLETEDDLTRARAAGLSDDLFHHGRPIGLAPKLAALRGVTLDDVVRVARNLPTEQRCVATVGPREL